MKVKNFTSFFSLVVLAFIFTAANVNAQWSGSYGNEWLAGKYGQSWVRIGVNATGIHRIPISSLPSAFQNADKTKLQLWRRGVQVSIIKADATEILFYAVPNDGASDQQLYRLPTSRKNPYFSLYSNESAYFLTIGTTNGARAAVENTPVDGSITPLASHVRTELKTYQNEFTHTTLYSLRPSTLNSYFEEGKTGTGSRIPISNALSTIYTSNPKSINYTNSYVPEPFSYQIKVPAEDAQPNVKIMLSGRYGNPKVDVFAGKNANTLRLASTVYTSDFNPYELSFDLLPEDYDATGNGTLGFQSTVNLNYFSVTYFTVTYDQLIDMQGLGTYEFNFPAAASGSKSRMTIANPAANTKFYDISNVNQPRIISGNAADLMVTRNGSALKLLATNQQVEVLPAKISTITFPQYNPANTDYLIVTNQTLESSAAAFATYRQTTTPGRKFKPAVMKIKDVYNVFNYGEPSPVAIRHMVDYMISDGNKDKYLLILGKSVTRPDRVTKELPDEVPTVGFPGSDVLLTDGLQGTPEDVPAIPVGRISATANQQVLDYLAKISTYESQKDLSWRKNVMHMSGGKDQSEINQFSGYLATIGGNVTGAPFSGTVIQKIKTIAEDVQEQITIAPELNGTGATIKGLGMVSYFGHGSTYRTDLNAGYATDPAKGYNNTNKYPVLFYNGCGVGNVFSNLFDPTVNAATSRPMSLDWLLAPAKGAIVVFGNDWDAYASTSNEYLDRLYPLLFTSDDKRLSIGQILQNVAAQTKAAKGYTYNADQNSRVAGYYDADRANIHQVLLQGDPALKVLLTESALPVNFISFDAKVTSPSQVTLTWKTASERNNSHFIVEKSYNARNFEAIGRVEGKGDSESEATYNFIDTHPLAGTSYYRLTQVDVETIENGVKVQDQNIYSKLASVSRDNFDRLVVSPNPSADIAEIKLDAPVSIKSWNLFDINGRMIKKQQTGSKINLSGLQAGDYIIKITTLNGDVYTRKIVKL
ncbi:putative type IX secretion system sortase PorU2 [Dyadobacter sandarakinus]|uniref:T9SS type A sorting domain-containing protein n=1 Tax=Dyadobacter sandarakinus TaxID=2747268 RepID=A0ABX7IBI7_9BACT|nr:C25 family cysteine peptidase [Dyadobacter sandarakinus]QRR03484.1 T9SS type A sorting domain-containing protein [Dyadobacter sandarakinus]